MIISAKYQPMNSTTNTELGDRIRGLSLSSDSTGVYPIQNHSLDGEIYHLSEGVTLEVDGRALNPAMPIRVTGESLAVTVGISRLQKLLGLTFVEVKK